MSLKQIFIAITCLFGLTSGEFRSLPALENHLLKNQYLPFVSAPRQWNNVPTFFSGGNGYQPKISRVYSNGQTLYQLSNATLEIIDIHNSLAPTLIKRISIPVITTDHINLKTEGNRIYIVANYVTPNYQDGRLLPTRATLVVIDITNPKDASIAHTHECLCYLDVNAGKGYYAYQNKFEVVDLSDLVSRKTIATGSLQNNIMRIIGAGARIYALTYNENHPSAKYALEGIDIGPQTVQSLGIYRSMTLINDFVVSGSFVYVASGFDSYEMPTGGSLTIVDWQNIMSPTVLNTINISSAIIKVLVKDQILIFQTRQTNYSGPQKYYYDGVYAYDVQNPQEPKRILIGGNPSYGQIAFYSTDGNRIVIDKGNELQLHSINHSQLTLQSIIPYQSPFELNHLAAASNGMIYLSDGYGEISTLAQITTDTHRLVSQYYANPYPRCIRDGAAQDNLAYVITCSGAIHQLDVSDPKSPISIASIPAINTQFASGLNQITIGTKGVYVGAHAGLYRLDILPTNTITLTQINPEYPSNEFFTPRVDYMKIDGEKAFLHAGPLPFMPSGAPVYKYLIDLSNTPQIIISTDTSLFSAIHHNKLYQQNTQGQLVIQDITNLKQITEITSTTPITTTIYTDDGHSYNNNEFFVREKTLFVLNAIVNFNIDPAYFVLQAIDLSNINHPQVTSRIIIKGAKYRFSYNSGLAFKTFWQSYLLLDTYRIDSGVARQTLTFIDITNPLVPRYEIMLDVNDMVSLINVVPIKDKLMFISINGDWAIWQP